MDVGAHFNVVKVVLFFVLYADDIVLWADASDRHSSNSLKVIPLIASKLSCGVQNKPYNDITTHSTKFSRNIEEMTRGYKFEAHMDLTLKMLTLVLYMQKLKFSYSDKCQMRVLNTMRIGEKAICSFTCTFFCILLCSHTVS